MGIECRRPAWRRGRKCLAELMVAWQPAKAGAKTVVGADDAGGGTAPRRKWRPDGMIFGATGNSFLAARSSPAYQCGTGVARLFCCHDVSMIGGTVVIG